jgi:[ribosomal protein S5]-alanine N-acetyltransferase
MTLPLISAEAPLLSTRLLLRPVTEQDLPDLLLVNGDPAVTEFLPYESWRGEADAQAWLLRMQAQMATGTAQQLVVQRRDSGRVIGGVLLFKHDAPSARIELGYVLGREHWRQGHAVEALRTVCSHAYTAMGLRRIEAEVNPDNTASNAVLRALGFVQEGRLRQRWTAKGRSYDTLIYGCLADEWTGQPGDSVG